MNPWGEDRADARQAFTSANIARAFGGSSADESHYSLSRMMSADDPDDETDYSDQHAAAFDALDRRLWRKNRGKDRS